MEDTTPTTDDVATTPTKEELAVIAKRVAIAAAKEIAFKTLVTVGVGLLSAAIFGGIEAIRNRGNEDTTEDTPTE